MSNAQRELLQKAIVNRKTAEIETMVKANPDLMNSVSSFMAPFIYACKMDKVDSAKILLKYVDNKHINDRGYGGNEYHDKNMTALDYVKKHITYYGPSGGLVNRSARLLPNEFKKKERAPWIELKHMIRDKGGKTGNELDNPTLLNNIKRMFKNKATKKIGQHANHENNKVTKSVTNGNNNIHTVRTLNEPVNKNLPSLAKKYTSTLKHTMSRRHNFAPMPSHGGTRRVKRGRKGPRRQ